MPAIQVQGLTKAFRTYKPEPGFVGAVKGLVRRKYDLTLAVKEVSFAIEAGELVGFLGPNGAGKTTTLKMLAGLLHPTSGAATVLGYVPWKRDDGYRRQFALLLGQKNQLWWDLPARESLDLNAKIGLRAHGGGVERVAAGEGQAQRRGARAVPGRTDENGIDRLAAARAAGPFSRRADHWPGRGFPKNCAGVFAALQRPPPDDHSPDEPLHGRHPGALPPGHHYRPRNDFFRRPVERGAGPLRRFQTGDDSMRRHHRFPLGKSCQIRRGGRTKRRSDQTESQTRPGHPRLQGLA